MTLKLRSALSVLLSLGMLAACEEAPVEKPAVVRPVRIMTISDTGGIPSFSYPGEIQGVQYADLAFEVAGRLVALPGSEGINVTEGQLLARLDPADYQSALDAAQAKFNSAKETFDRYAEIFERGAISRQDLDDRRRQFEVEQADLTKAQKALSDTELRAPFTGRVGRTYVDNFNNVQAKEKILLLQDLSELEIIVHVPEQDWAKARPGLTLAQQTENARPVVTISSIAGRSFPAVISEVAAAADPVTRTFEGRARFDTPEDVIILPGMSATLTVNPKVIAMSVDNIVRVPANAVLGADDGSSFVWLVDAADMSVSAAAVTVGQMSGSDIVILDGLKSGDRIAVSGIQHLAEEMRIRELSD